MQGAQWQVAGYENVRDLGRGGFGQVALARRQSDGALVAIKYLAPKLLEDAGFREEFRREAQTLAEVQSPHVVRLHAYVEQSAADGSGIVGAAIVMDFVPGGTLALLLKQHPDALRTPEVALGVLKGSLLGLDAAHTRGVVHRDYKPANVLVRDDGVSVLADFGIAVRSGDSTNAGLGTVPYMAPEQFTGAVSPAADVYSATAVFFECVTGHRPFHPGDSAAVADWAAVHREQPVPLDDVPDLLRPLVARGMAKNPTERPAQAREFAEELERIAHVAYGPDWERRGQRVLIGVISTLVAGGLLLSLLPEVVPSAAPPAPAPAQPPSAPGMGRPSSARQSGQPGSRPGGRSGNPLRRAHARFGTTKTTIAATAAAAIVAGGVALAPWHGSKKPEPMPIAATSPVIAQPSHSTSSAPAAAPTPANPASPSTPQARVLAAPVYNPCHAIAPSRLASLLKLPDQKFVYSMNQNSPDDAPYGSVACGFRTSETSAHVVADVTILTADWATVMGYNGHPSCTQRPLTDTLHSCTAPTGETLVQGPGSITWQVEALSSTATDSSGNPQPDPAGTLALVRFLAATFGDSSAPADWAPATPDPDTAFPAPARIDPCTALPAAQLSGILGTDVTKLQLNRFGAQNGSAIACGMVSGDHEVAQISMDLGTWDDVKQFNGTVNCPTRQIGTLRACQDYAALEGPGVVWSLMVYTADSTPSNPQLDQARVTALAKALAEAYPSTSTT